MKIHNPKFLRSRKQPEFLEINLVEAIEDFVDAKINCNNCQDCVNELVLNDARTILKAVITGLEREKS